MTRPLAARCLPLVAVLGCSRAPAGPPGIHVEEIQHKGARWTVATVDLTQADLRLVGQGEGVPEPHTLENVTRWLGTEGVVPVVAMNAGIYMEDRRPLGLHVEDGKAYRGVNNADGYGNFYLKPNGIFSLGPAGAAITPTTDWRARPVTELVLATQSGPMLANKGVLHPKLQENSPNLKRRNGVGVRSATVVVLASSEDRVRFHDMATLFVERLKCPDALYLDGTVSALRTPLHPDAEGDPAGYSGVLVATPKPPRPPRTPPSTPAAKPTEVKPAEDKPAEDKPTEAQPAEAKPAEAKPDEATPAEATAAPPEP